MDFHCSIRLILLVAFCSIELSAQQNTRSTSRPSTDPVVLLHRLIGNWDVFSSTRLDSSIGTMKVIPVAKAKAVFSTFKLGQTDNPSYEANSIWVYDSTMTKVFAYEVNSLGAVLTHIGGFKSDGTLELLRFDKSNPATILQESLMTWTSESWLEFTAFFTTQKGRQKATWVFKKVQ